MPSSGRRSPRHVSVSSHIILIYDLYLENSTAAEDCKKVAMLMEAFEEAKARGKSDGEGDPSASHNVEASRSVLAPTSRGNAIAGPSKKRKRNADVNVNVSDDDDDDIFNSPEKLDITDEEKHEHELERADASEEPQQANTLQLENGTMNKNGSVFFNGRWITAYEYTSELAKERNRNWERELDIANGLHTIVKDNSPEPEAQSLPPNFVLPPPRVSIPRKAKADATNTYALSITRS